MPKKLKVLVVLLALGLVLSVVESVVALLTDYGSVTTSVLNSLFGAVLLVGVLRGRERARDPLS